LSRLILSVGFSLSEGLITFFIFVLVTSIFISIFAIPPIFLDFEDGVVLDFEYKDNANELNNVHLR
jgi:hypothetical protein